MATPQFILDLRRHIGHAPLWLAGSSAVVVRDGLRGRQVLLVQRADNGEWTPVCGIIEPGERPDEAILREIHEETGVMAEIVQLVRVNVAAPITYPNGDRCQFLDHDFLCRWVSGEPQVGDDESSHTAFFDLDELPDMKACHRRRIETAIHPPQCVIMSSDAEYSDVTENVDVTYQEIR
ncbi:NUDIX domain-containing protein [Cutibacterium sp. WCA-380-WT-3A]|uniref:NUDIX domain-containing protein n=1 Tax=Cutibacterium porci TaxID=2605781 RepID=A0A7K0J7N9_9ACTN|nr:NUDIX domain-containing protein [Cutibacterium porci]MSS45976.1 NUDIX domain-containing protein [Cutibacterium porci]